MLPWNSHGIVGIDRIPLEMIRKGTQGELVENTGRKWLAFDAVQESKYIERTIPD